MDYSHIVNDTDMKLSRTTYFTRATVIIVALIAAYIFLLRVFVGSDWSQTGVFGDSFGGLNAFFSALAFVAVIYSISQQNEVLKKQDEEIAANKAALDQQIKTQNLDRFENTFFRILPMIEVLAQEISDVTLSPVGGTERSYGVRSIGRYLNSFRSSIRLYKDYNEMNRVNIASAFSEKLYNKGFNRYLDHLLSVHRYVANHEHLTLKEKRFYVNILSSSISPQELVLYYYFFVVQIGSTYSDREPDIFSSMDYNLLGHIEHYKYYNNPNWLG